MSFRVRLGLVVAALGCCVARLNAGEVPGGKRALLVGCTRYANLPEKYQLKGPANDVVLLRELLVGRFGFPGDGIVTLSEAAGGENRPTRAHIVREFERLAREARPGDQVVVFLAGHGSQQPEANPDDPEDYEPDGLDEIFLPADVGVWDNRKGKVANAVVDNELRAWLKAIQDRGAFLWVIIDACHSATMIRGADDEVVRDVPAEDLVPARALDEARQRAARRAAAGGERSRGAEQPERELLRDAGRRAGLVAIYACQSTEPTVETSLPPRSPGRKRYGLLTYTLCQVLSQADARLSYAELVQRVYDQYVARGRTAPTPLVEGRDRDREVLGVRQWPGRSRILLARDEDEGLKVNAGSLTGLTEGSVLAVYPPAGTAGADRPVGHVRVGADVQPLSARVEPCAYAGLPAKPDLKEGRCEPVYIDYGDQRLAVAVDSADSRGKPVPEDERRRLAGELARLAAEKGSLVKAVDQPRDAQWLVRPDGGRVYLVPASGWVTSKDAHELPPLFGPAPAGEGLGPWLQDRLGRVARVQNLLRLTGEAGAETAGPGAGVKVEMEVVRLRSKSDKVGEPIPWQSAALAFQGGDRIGLRVRNPNKFAVDVSVLFLDSGYGIAPFFPDPERNEVNRLYAGESTPLFRAKVTDRTRGLEHFLVIAVKAQGPPVDFTALAQPTLEKAQAAERTRGAGNPLGGPLGRLLQNAVFAQGGTRGLSRDEVDDYALRVLSWKTVPRKGGK